MTDDAAPKKSKAVPVSIVVAALILAAAIIIVGFVVPARAHRQELKSECDARGGYLTQVGKGDPLCLTYN